MCGNAPGMLQFEEHVGTDQPNRLSLRSYVDVGGGKKVCTGLYFLCPETMDFMIAHLTKMRAECEPCQRDV